jgi:nicotinate dehydrogenase subunit B
MIDTLTDTFTPEAERYEFNEGPKYRFHLDRRDFFKVTGGGLFVLFVVKQALAGQESGRASRGGPSDRSLPSDVASWLHIAEDGAITAYTGKVEVGQEIRTSLAQAVAEELHCPASSIALVMGDTDLTPYDMGTFGSRTTPTMAPELHKVAAAARESLIDFAAEQWKIDRSAITVENGKVVSRSTNQSVDFGRLTKGRTFTRTVSENTVVTPATEWKIAGTPLPNVNGPEVVTGRHKYPSDIKLPGMLYGKVLRPSSFGATLASVNDEAAKAIPGVVVVRDGEFAGVAAPDEYTATRAAESIKAEWRTKPQLAGRELFDFLKKTGDSKGHGSTVHSAGSMEAGLSAAATKLQQSYTLAYIAHAPLEPRAAVAQWENGKLTVWTGTQRPFGVRSELAEAFHLPEKQVRVIMPDTGSGYGGKHTGETALEAARLAKAAGKPVKVIWTREEEFTWAYFRPAGVIDITSGVTSDGKMTAWEFHNYNSGGSGIETLYDIPNQVIVFHGLPAEETPLRQGSYRGLAATANHFARESHMDELAYAVKMDPLEFRLKNLKDERLRAVFEAAAKAFGWGRRSAPAGSGFGIAGGFEKGGYVATCAEVSVDKASGNVKITRAVSAFECGAIVNPDGLRNQVEGAMLMGIGGALFEAVEFDNGKILNPHFAQYRVPRFSDVPIVEVVLLDRKDRPSAGAGETPIVGLAPAVGNAIFAATGVRLRSMPMAPKGTKKN